MATDAADTPASRAGGTKAPILEVRDLSVEFFVEGEWFPAAVGVEYDVCPGEVLAIVGESGSGKTQSSMSLIGLLPPNGRATGSAKLAGRELLGLRHKDLSHVRGKDVAVIFQEPMTALNPVYTIGFQIVETLRTHFGVGPREGRERAIELLRLVDIPDPAGSVDKYPHQLSGGQRQRAMIAQALACDPKLLIADEPTTALDVTVQAEILKLMRDLRSRIDSGIVLITHDMGVVADLADRVIVMRHGRIVERGAVADVFYRPQHEYTRQLLDAVPHLGRGDEPAEGTTSGTTAVPVAGSVAGAAGVAGATGVTGATEGTAASTASPAGARAGEPPALEAKGLVIEYPGRGSVPAFRAVDEIDLTIGVGEVVGLVGESGSGKTTVGRAAVGLLPVAGGTLTIAGQDMAGIGTKELRAVRENVSIVFQDPGSSLNPRLPIGESIGEPLKLHKIAKGADLNRRVEKLLDQVHLARGMRNRYPHELSGGQRQRVGIARALALSPRLLVADEPTSALDVSVQARVLELFQELQHEHGFACLFISHDLAVVEMVSSRIAVMHRGRLVEQGAHDRILRSPEHDYTRRLLAAVPVPDPDEQRIRREERDRILEEELVRAGVHEAPGADPAEGRSA